MSYPIYSPLNSAQAEIRLLMLQPAHDYHAPITGFLSHTSLRQPEPYEALSYTWGSKVPSRTMELNGQLLEIQENADAALRRLRRPSTVRTLWVDAICINQQDKHETDSQLVLMRAIYEQATQVCVWLGEMTEASQITVYDMQKRVATEYKFWISNVHNTVIANLVSPTSLLVNGFNGLAAQFTADLNRELEIGELRELLSRPWWKRLWVMQEIIVARKVVLMCGKETFEWDGIERSINRNRSSLRGAAEAFGYAIEAHRHVPDENYRNMARLRNMWHHGKWNVSIFELLYEFRRQICSQPQDRIYGVLGLISASRDYGIVPDSAASTVNIFVSTARSIISRSENLNLLNCKREWQSIENTPRPEFAYSLVDQARYHDVKTSVTDGAGTAVRKGWARLPPGWERIQPMDPFNPWRFSGLKRFKHTVAGKTCHYLDHNTGNVAQTSPMVTMGLPPPQAQHIAKQKLLPPGWVKEWDNLGRARVHYSPASTSQSAVPPPPPPASEDLSSLPSWVPNWCAIRDIDPEPLLDWSEENPRYWAAGRTLAVVDMDPSSPETIGVEGIWFDDIVQIGEPWHPAPDKAPPLSRRGISVLEAWEALAVADPDEHPCPYAGLAGKRQEALWRTVLADDAGHLAAPASAGSYVEVWYDRRGWTSKGMAALASLEERTSRGIWNTAMTAATAEHVDMDMLSELLAIDPEGCAKDALSSADKYGAYLRRIHRACAHRALFVTRRGYVGLAPWNARPGDGICVLKGGRTPFLLREVPVVGRYNLVGEAYVCGIMAGEVLAWESADAATMMFYLV